ERADGCVRAHIGALVTLDTRSRVPGGNRHGDAAFFVSGGAGGHGAVLAAQEHAHGQVVAHLCVDRVRHGGDEVRRSGTFGLFHVESGVERSPIGGHVHLDVFAAAVYGRIVLGDDVGAFFTVGFFDEVLHLLDGQIVRNDIGDLEEGGLQDGV